jgi:hypothetical protein
MKEAVFTMKLESDLRDDFMAAANAVHQPASQVVRELMREFVNRQREKVDHEAFVRAKVDTARRSVRDGLGRSNEDVEAEFAARRTRSAS